MRCWCSGNVLKTHFYFMYELNINNSFYPIRRQWYVVRKNGKEQYDQSANSASQWGVSHSRTGKGTFREECLGKREEGRKTGRKTLCWPCWKWKKNIGRLELAARWGESHIRSDRKVSGRKSWKKENEIEGEKERCLEWRMRLPLFFSSFRSTVSGSRLWCTFNTGSSALSFRFTRKLRR